MIGFIIHIKYQYRKVVETMAVIYATLIVKGIKTINDVPARIRDKVKQVLIDLDLPELAEDATDKA
jgi:hypothetical protein